MTFLSLAAYVCYKHVDMSACKPLVDLSALLSVCMLSDQLKQPFDLSFA